MVKHCIILINIVILFFAQNSAAQSASVCWETPYPNGININKNNYTINQIGVVTSQNKINANNGFIEFEIQSPLTTESFWIGLAESENVQSWKDLNYSIGVDAFGSPETKHAYNFGTWQAGFSRVRQGDILGINIQNGQVFFTINGSIFHQQTASHTADLQIVAYFNVIQENNYQTQLDITSSTECDDTPPTEDLIVQLEKTDSDFQQNNGSITANIVSGTPPFSLQWSNGTVVNDSNSTSHTIENLAPGSYSLTVTDSNEQNINPAPIVIIENQASEFTIQMSKTDPNPTGGNNGTVTAEISGATPPFLVKWSTGEQVNGTYLTTQKIYGLTAEDYQVTVTDGNNETVISSIITLGGTAPPSNMTVSLSKTDVTTVGGNDGTLTAEITNGTPPFLVEWSRGERIDGTYLTTQKIYGLVAGNYTITVTDNTNQVITPEAVTINEPTNPNPFSATLTSTDVTFQNGNDGTVTANITAGTTPYSIQWSNGEEVTGSYATEHTIYALEAGTYSATITDQNGQTIIPDAATVNDPTNEELTAALTKTDVTATGANDGTVTARVNGGDAPYKVEWSSGQSINMSNETTYILNNLSPGTYDVTITDNTQNVVSPDSVTVNDYAPSDCGSLFLTNCLPTKANVDSSLGEPQNITLPNDKNGVYTGNRTVSTFREMFGTNIILTNTFDYPAMQNISDIFSYPRVFLFHNKDYWDDGIGEPTTENKKRIIRPRQIERLKVLVDSDNKPFLRGSFMPGDKIINIDPNTGDFVETPITPQNYNNYSAAQQNTYTGYMNSNFRFVQEHYDKWIGEENKNANNPYKFKGLTVTLTVVNANFPTNIASEYNFPANWWKAEDWGNSISEIKCSARAYAKIFARTYAPTAADCSTCTRYVDVLEIGNESWHYDAPTYHAIVEGFLEGFAEYYQSDDSNKIKLIPAAFQAQHEENNEPANAGSSASWKDYLGTRLNAEHKCYLNGINLHPYSNQLTDNSAYFTQRLLAYPEDLQTNGDADSKFLYIKNGWKWVADNMPQNSQNIYVTEFGWDTENNDCGNGARVGVGEFTQGLYISRALLNMARFGVTRATLFEASDDPALHGTCQFAYHSSGLWNVDPVSGGLPKQSQKMAHKFMELLGQHSFHYVLSERDNGAYAYLLERNGSVSYLVAWHAADANNQTPNQVYGNTFNTSLDLNIGGRTYQLDEQQNWYFLDDNITVDDNGNVTSLSPLNETQKKVVFNNDNYELRPIPIVIPIQQQGECVDNAAPQINCPQDITQTQAPDNQETTVTWIPPSVLDDCDNQPTVVGSHQPGDSFPLGTTTVNYTATDASGKSSSCSFQVTIESNVCEDNMAPQLACPADITQEPDGDQTVVTWVPPGVTDDCDNQPAVTGTHESGDSFPLGTTTVTYTATDASGKSTTCSFEVTIERGACTDNAAPELTCPDNITQAQNTAGDGELTTVSWTAPTPSDDCDNAPLLTSSHQPGDAFPVGTTLVTYTAQDASGKSTDCTFTITIEEDNTGEPTEYCASNGQQPWERWIEQVQLQNIDNQSSKQASPPVGYGDFTTQVANLKRTQSYEIELTPGYSWRADPSHDGHWRVWIDWNQDGDFNDPGEAIVQVNSNRKVTATIAVPSSAKVGDTRLRIAFKNGGFSTACESFELGEVEDYGIMVE